MEIGPALDADSPVLVVASHHSFRDAADGLVRELLDRHEAGIVITADRTFEELEDELSYQGLDTDRLWYIDLVSETRGLYPDDERVIGISSPTAYNDISIALSDQLDAAAEDCFVVLDSFTAWLLHGSLKRTGNFVKKLTEKAGDRAVPFYIMLLKEQVDEDVIDRFMTFCGSEVDMTGD